MKRTTETYRIEVSGDGLRESSQLLWLTLEFALFEAPLGYDEHETF